MKAIVTGAAGFIGSHVAEVLSRAGHRVLAIDDLSGGLRENVPEGVIFEKMSVLDGLDPLFNEFQPDLVFHLAAYAAEGLSHHIPVFNYQNNVVGTANVLSAACRVKAKHFVFTSSIAVYGHPVTAEPFDEATSCNPCDPYGVAKLACEHHIRACEKYYGGPSFTIFRPHNVYGPRQNIADPFRNVVGIFMARAIQGSPMPVFGDGRQSRSFSYITNVAESIATAPFLAGAKNAVFNIGGDEQMSIQSLAQHVSEVMGVPLLIEWLAQRKEVLHAHCNHEREKKVFGEFKSKSISIIDGLRMMAEDVKSKDVPAATKCPSPVEISDQLPPSWRKHLGVDQ